MTVNVKKFFNELLPAAMSRNPKYFQQIGLNSKFIITGEGGGEWWVNASNSGQSVTQGDLDNCDSTIAMAVEDFRQVYQDHNAIMPLFFGGKVKVTGDPMAITKMTKLLTFVN